MCREKFFITIKSIITRLSCKPVERSTEILPSLLAATIFTWKVGYYDIGKDKHIVIAIVSNWKIIENWSLISQHIIRFKRKMFEQGGFGR